MLDGTNGGSLLGCIELRGSKTAPQKALKTAVNLVGWTVSMMVLYSAMLMVEKMTPEKASKMVVCLADWTVSLMVPYFAELMDVKMASQKASKTG